jgi:hypothetical protein
VPHVRIWPGGDGQPSSLPGPLIPFTHGFDVLLSLHFLRGLLLGVFIPATIGITLRHLDERFWLVGLAIYSMRVPLSQNVGVFLVGPQTVKREMRHTVPAHARRNEVA